MEQIKSAILSGQKSVIVEGVLIEKLPVCPRDTQKNKEKFAEQKAKELYNIIKS